MTDKRLAPAEEYVEPEILGPGGYREEGPRFTPPPPPLSEKPGLLQRLKATLAAVLGLLGAGLFLFGAFLTSTVIGAIIGIPMMLAGAIVFFLLFKLLASGANNTFIFRRF